jgi:hypothetical protein
MAEGKAKKILDLNQNDEHRIYPNSNKKND